MFCLSHFKFGCGSVVMWDQSSFNPANIANDEGQLCTPRKEMSVSRGTAQVSVPSLVGLKMSASWMSVFFP